MADRALAEERGAALGRAHRRGRRERVLGHGAEPAGQLAGRSAVRGTGLQRVQGRHQHVQHGLLADIRAAALLHRLDALAEDFRDAGGILRRARLAHRHEQAAVERPGRAADLHHQGHAGLLQGLVERQGGELRRAPRAIASKPRRMLMP